MATPSPKRRRSARDTNRIRMDWGRHGALHRRRMEELFFQEQFTTNNTTDNKAEQVPAPRRSWRQQELRIKQEQEQKMTAKPVALTPVVYPTIKIQKWKLQRVHESPNIYMMDDFLSGPELEHLDDIVQKMPFRRSYVDNPDTAQTMQDDDHRTSTFVSLTKNQTSKIAAIEQKAAAVLGLFSSTAAIEPLQLVRYLPGQFFGVHHDMGDYNEETGVVDLPDKHCFVKRRLVTIFVYLNDLEPEQGGCTMFPECKQQSSSNGAPLRVRPKRGRAVLWSNVTKDGYPDARTIHAGEPVKDNRAGNNTLPSQTNNRPTKGGREKQSTPAVVKYGLNIWMCET